MQSDRKKVQARGVLTINHTDTRHIRIASADCAVKTNQRASPDGSRRSLSVTETEKRKVLQCGHKNPCSSAQGISGVGCMPQLDQWIGSDLTGLRINDEDAAFRIIEKF